VTSSSVPPPGSDPADPGDPFAASAIEPDGVAAPEEQKRVPRWLIALLIVIVIAAPTGFIVHVPYYSVGPGPSVDVLTLIDVRGAKTYPSKGKLLLTTASVSVNTLNLWDAFRAWIDPDVALAPRSNVVIPGLTEKEQDIENQLEMAESKFEAEVAAFKALGLAVTKIAGARILTVIEGTPAFGALRARDLIVSVDGHRVTSIADTVKFLRRHKVGDRVSIGYVRDGKRFTAVLKMAPSEADPKRPAIGDCNG